jgi:hypothetical protein
MGGDVASEHVMTVIVDEGDGLMRPYANKYEGDRIGRVVCLCGWKTQMMGARALRLAQMWHRISSQLDNLDEDTDPDIDLGGEG